jgi:chromate reductase
MQNKILIINASIRGEQGNSNAISLKAKDYIEKSDNSLVEIYNLTNPKSTIKEVYDLLDKFDAFIVVSGTYWNNIGSNLQRFIEVCTPFENTKAFFGKPLAAIVSMDSVGGVEVAAKIINVFSGFGCWSPPCSTIIISRLGEEAVNRSKDMEDDPNEDVWRLDDIEILIDNLIIACGVGQKQWKVWPNIQLYLENDSWPDFGELNLDSPRFI